MGLAAISPLGCGKSRFLALIHEFSYLKRCVVFALALQKYAGAFHKYNPDYPYYHAVLSYSRRCGRVNRNRLSILLLQLSDVFGMILVDENDLPTGSLQQPIRVD